MEIIDKFADFNKYCKTCKHCDKKEWADPCNDCLDNPVNQNSTKPVNYEKDDKKVKNRKEK